MTLSVGAAHALTLLDGRLPYADSVINRGVLLGTRQPHPSGFRQPLRNLSGQGYGDSALTTSARSVAMGNTTIVNEDGPAALFSNPAGLANLTPLVALDLSLQNLHDNEGRNYPTFDNFNNGIGPSFFTNTSHGSFVPLGAASFRLSLPSGYTASLAAGSHNPMNWDYDYQETILQNLTTRSARASIRTRGTIRSAFTGGTAVAAPFGLKAGVSFDVLRGSYSDVAALRDVDGTSPGTDFTVSSGWDKVTGTDIRVGVEYDVRNQFRTSLTWQKGATLTGDWSFSVTGASVSGGAFSEPVVTRAVKLPDAFGWGVRIQPVSDLAAVFVGEVRYVRWSRLTDSLVAAPGNLTTVPGSPLLSQTTTYRTGLENGVEYHLGLEHTFESGVPLRFGFYSQPSPSSRSIYTSHFTVGTGYTVGKVTADLGLDFGTREYQVRPDAFEGQRDARYLKPNWERVDERFVNLLFTLGYRF